MKNWLHPSLRRQSNIWGLWMTLLFGAAIAAVFVLVQLATAYVFVLYEAAGDLHVSAHTVEFRLDDNGLAFALVTIASGVVCSTLTWWVVRLRTGAGAFEYLGTRRIRAGTLLAWLLVTAGLIFASDLVEPLLKDPRGPDFTLAMYRSATSAPLLWFAMVVVAPAFEELFFRGFLLQGLRYSKLGPVLAVVLTSLAWATSHGQYSSAEISEIFVFGLVLGVARVRTESLYTPIAMHAFVNLVTLIQAALAVAGH